MIKDRLKANAVPIQLPIGAEEDFRGIIDLIDMKADVYYDDLGKDIRVEEIPEELKEKAQQYHDALIEAVAENDEALMEKYLEGEELTKEEVKAALRRETVSNTIVPVVCGTSYKNKGVQKLLDAIVDYMPIMTVTGMRASSNSFLQRWMAIWPAGTAFIYFDKWGSKCSPHRCWLNKTLAGQGTG